MFLNVKHPKSIISGLKVNEGLPFCEVLSSESINQAIEKLEYRKRYFSPDVTLWAFLSQVLDDDQSLQAAVARVSAFFVSQGCNAPSINTSAYSQARTRLPIEVLTHLTRNAAEQLEEQVPSNWYWRQRVIKSIDGSTVSMPDTIENQEIYPQQKSQKPGLGFPLARIVAVLSQATGAVIDLAMGAYAGDETGEHALLRQLMHVFKPNDIVIGDKYYPSFFLMAMLMKMGVDGVFPMHSARRCDFREGKRLGKKEHIVQWRKPKKPEWMEQELYDEFGEGIEVREVSIQESRKGFRKRTRVMVTTFLDQASVTKEDLAELYNYRWTIELDLRSIKDTMHMGVLRGKSPEMVQKEIWMHLLAYNLVRKIMAQSGAVFEKKPRELSFKLALQVIKAFRYMGLFYEKEESSYLEILKAIANKTIGNRAGRQEPRRIKRRPKPYPLLSKPRRIYQKGAV